MIWRNGKREGERAGGDRKNISVDTHANGTIVDHLRWWNDERAEVGRVDVDKSEDGSEDIAVYVPERLREVSNTREVEVRCDRGGCGNGSWASVHNDDPEGSRSR